LPYSNHYAYNKTHNHKAPAVGRSTANRNESVSKGAHRCTHGSIYTWIYKRKEINYAWIMDNTSPEDENKNPTQQSKRDCRHGIKENCYTEASQDESYKP